MRRRSMSNTSRRVSTPLAGVAAALLCAGLAACSSSGSSTGSTGSSTASITFGDLTPNTDLTPVYAAVDQGFFKKAGLNVTIQKFTGGGATSVAALATGSVQIAAGGPTNFIGDISKKVITGKLFAEMLDTNYDIVVSKGITSIPQLKGKVIGVSGADSADEIFMAATLQHYGLSLSDVTPLTAGATSERLTALSTGKIQAIVGAATERKEEDAVGTVLIPATSNPVKVPAVTLWASSSYLASNSATLKKFLSVIDQSAAWVKTAANEKAAVADCVQGSGSTAAECEQTIAHNVALGDGSYTWSSTSALDMPGIKEALAATSIVIPAAKSLTVGDIADTSLTGTQP